MKDVFISYRREGGDLMAHLLYHRLTNNGYTVFLDRQLGSGRFDKALLKNIEECTDFLLVVSPDCFKRCVDQKDWVRQEVEQALLCGKNIIPVIMTGCKIPDDLPDSMQSISKHNGIEFDFNWEEPAYEKLKQMMDAKPRVSIADLNVSELDGTDRQANKEDIPLHERMSQEALRDTSNSADDHVIAIRASQGDAEAQFRLWKIYRSKDSDYTYPTEEMMYWLKLAVEQNHPKAICAMGKCHYHGYGVDRNPAKAVIFYRKSLEYEDNLTEALWSLGDCYLNGIGVESNVLQAAQLYKQAMEAGDSCAAAKYIDLVRTGDAVRGLKKLGVTQETKSEAEKKEKNIVFSPIFRLLAIRQLGVVKYGTLGRFRILNEHGHTMDQISEDRTQKYQSFLGRWPELWLVGCILFFLLMVMGVEAGAFEISLASFFCELKVIFAEIDIPDFIRIPLMSACAEMRGFFSGIAIPDSVRAVLAPIWQWLAAFLDSTLPALFVLGMVFWFQMWMIEMCKDFEIAYWEGPQKNRKILERYMIFVLIYLLGGTSIALLALILYLILPHKILFR